MSARAAYQRRLGWRINAHLRRLAEAEATARTGQIVNRSDNGESN